MPFLTINDEKCTSCGACADVCPVRIIHMEDGAPEAVRWAPKACINCGHCTAVCPTAALSTPRMKPEDCLPADTGLSFPPETMEQLLRSRRSIRSYTGEPVDRNSIEAAINVARFAESGHNMQPVRWAVYNDPEKIRKISRTTRDWMRYMADNKPEEAAKFNLGAVADAWDAGQDLITRDAPALILAVGTKDNPMLPTAAPIALVYLEFALQSHGLGSCWAGFVHLAFLFWPPMAELLALPEGTAMYGGLLTGRSKHTYYRMPERNPADIHWD